MSVPFLLPSLLADPEPSPGTTAFTNARLFDGTGSAVRDNVSVIVTDGYITTVSDSFPRTPQQSTSVAGASCRGSSTVTPT